MAELDTSNFKDKDSKKPEYRELYEKHDFIEAYGKHTDKRIEKDGPELAIGAKPDGVQDWDIHGNMQMDFLKSAGLKPEHLFLDIGCGTGRLACKMVPYLEIGHYTGIDISSSAINHCIELGNKEGWIERKPLFLYGDGSLGQLKDYEPNLIFAHSVFTHLPPEYIEKIFADLAEMSFGLFYFTYKLCESPIWQRSGLKQYQYHPDWFRRHARRYMLQAETHPFDWPAGQHTMVITR